MVLQKEDSLWFKNTFGDDPICIWVLLANDLCMLCPIHEIAVCLITCAHVVVFLMLCVYWEERLTVGGCQRVNRLRQ